MFGAATVILSTISTTSSRFCFFVVVQLIFSALWHMIANTIWQHHSHRFLPTILGDADPHMSPCHGTICFLAIIADIQSSAVCVVFAVVTSTASPFLHIKLPQHRNPLPSATSILVCTPLQSYLTQSRLGRILCTGEKDNVAPFALASRSILLIFGMIVTRSSSSSN